MTLLTRDAILTADDLSSEDVAVPEWGGSVRVRSLSGRERDAYEASMVTLGSGGRRQLRLENMRARLVALTVVDEQDARVFTDADVKELGQKSAAALERVWNVSRRLSGLTNKDVEELAEGLGSGPSGASTSDSQATSD